MVHSIFSPEQHRGLGGKTLGNEIDFMFSPEQPRHYPWQQRGETLDDAGTYGNVDYDGSMLSPGEFKFSEAPSYDANNEWYEKNDHDNFGYGELNAGRYDKNDCCNDDSQFGPKNADEKPKAEGHVIIQLEGPEKENISPIAHNQQYETHNAFAEHTSMDFPKEFEANLNPKTPAKTPKARPKADDESSTSSMTSMHEFYTPCPKTPGNKASSIFSTMDHSVSYDSLNTTTASREHLLASHKKEKRAIGWDESITSKNGEHVLVHKKESRWEKQDELWEDESEEMVFVTPKQRESRNGWDGDQEEENHNSSSEDEFFSPLADYHSSNKETADDGSLMEGSSYNLMNEAKSLLNAAKRESRTPMPVIQDESHNDASDDGEFFSPLAEHDPHQSVWSQDEESFNGISHSAALSESLVEDGSTFLVNEVKNMLSATKQSRPLDNVPVRHFEKLPLNSFDGDERPERGPPLQDDTQLNSFGRHTPHVAADTAHSSQADIQLTPEEKGIPQTQHLQVTPHLHTLAASSLPAGALTVAFIQTCNCAATIETILSVLSNTTNGKQLKQPRLAQVAQRRLNKLQGSAEDMNGNKEIIQEEPQWRHFQRGNEWKVSLPPRIAAGRRGGKSVVWSQEVKDNAESSVAGNSLQSLSSLESSIPDSNAIVANAVACTPSVVKVGLQAAPTSSPSVHLSSIAESSLDMNLSESFTLGDESAYWKQDVENIDENVPAKTVVVLSGVDGPSEREVELIRELDGIRKAYEEAKEDVTRMTVMLKENERQKVRAMSCRCLFSWLKMHL